MVISQLWFFDSSRSTYLKVIRVEFPFVTGSVVSLEGETDTTAINSNDQLGYFEVPTPTTVVGEVSLPFTMTVVAEAQ